MGDQERKLILESPWFPAPNFKFPATGKRNLRFQYQWFTRWKWLLYSKMVDGAFCRYCSLFSSTGGGRGSQTLGVLVKKPFCRWKDAVEEFNGHENTSYHKDSIVEAENWLRVEKGKQPSVERQQNSALRQQITENRKSIIPIIETIIFCGRQGIALRAHRDHGDLNLKSNPTENEGNFRALLRFRASSGDVVLRNHLENGSKNAMYLSPKIQNEIIGACNDILLKKLANMINSAKCFTILADETTDISTLEQLSIGVRYIYEKQIREDFLQFVPVYDLTGKSLAKTILASLKNFGIKTEYLRGQGYDGASSMSGKFNGTKSFVQEAHPTAVYVHCASHSLNLAISSTCNIADLRNCCGTASKICSFFNTPKRSEVLKRLIQEKFPEAKSTRLKKICPTRWVERHDSILLLAELLPAIHSAFEEISIWKDTDVSSSAVQLQCAVEKSSFLVSLQILAKIFSLSLPLCRALQLENMNLLAAMNMVNFLKDKLQEMRVNCETEFSVIYDSTKVLTESLGISLATPRLSTKQTQRFNVKTESHEAYFRISIFVPFLDHFISELKSRFLNHQEVLGSFMCLIPTEESIITKVEEEQIKMLVSFYQEDLECSDVAAVGELHLWYKTICESKIISKNALDYYIACNEVVFPTISTLLKILVTLPVSTSTSERSFSTLRRIKTYLRNTIGQERLNGIAMLNIHRELSISPDEVIEEISKSPRRLDFRLN